MNHFPTYTPSEARVASIAAELSAASSPLDVHYDAAREVRAKGAGFYQFSGDEGARAREMEGLRRAREETLRRREGAGAVDLKPGDEGMGQVGEGGEGSAGSRASEKRRREIEERRRLVEAKRRKVLGSASAKDTSATERAPDPDPAGLADAQGPAPADPFAALEAQTSKTKGKGKGKGKGKTRERALDADAPLDDADAFLAQLEQDVLKGMR